MQFKVKDDNAYDPHDSVFFHKNLMERIPKALRKIQIFRQQIAEKDITLVHSYLRRTDNNLQAKPYPNVLEKTNKLAEEITFPQRSGWKDHDVAKNLYWKESAREWKRHVF